MRSIRVPPWQMLCALIVSSAVVPSGHAGVFEPRGSPPALAWVRASARLQRPGRRGGAPAPVERSSIRGCGFWVSGASWGARALRAASACGCNRRCRFADRLGCARVGKPVRWTVRFAANALRRPNNLTFKRWLVRLGGDPAISCVWHGCPSQNPNRVQGFMLDAAQILVSRVIRVLHGLWRALKDSNLRPTVLEGSRLDLP